MRLSINNALFDAIQGEELALVSVLRILLLTSTLLIAACGDDDPPPPTPEPVNQAPSADAGDDRTVSTGQTVTLDGSGSRDPENIVLRFAWEAPSGVTLTAGGTASPTFTAPTNIETVSLTFTLTVTDNGGLTAQDSVTIHVREPRLVTAEDHATTVRGVSVSRDGSLAVSGGIDGTVRLWNAETGTVIRTLGSHDGAVYAVAINADGTHAVSGGIDGTVRLWTWSQTSGGEVLYEDGTRSLGDKGIWIYAVALNKDGSRAASGGFDGQVRVWNTATSGANAGGEITYGASGDMRSLGNHGQHSVYGVSISDDGSRVLSGAADGTVRLWSVGSGIQERSLSDDEDATMGAVFGVSLSGDGTVAAAGSADDNVRVWNATTGAETHELAGHSHDVSSVSLNADKTRVLSAGGDGTVRLWSVDASDAANGEEIRALRRHTDYAWSASLSGDAALAVSGGGDGVLHFWGTATQPLDTTEAFQTAERDWGIATAGDVRSRELTDHSDSVLGVSLSADGRFALSGSYDDDARLWDTATGTRLYTLARHADRVNDVSLSADGRLAISGSDDNTTRLWDATTGTLLVSIYDNTDAVYSVALSADGRLAVSGNRDDTVRLWDAVTSERLYTMTGHTTSVWDVALSADGRLALSGSPDRTVRLWDTATGTRLRAMIGHTDTVWGVALSADGRLALSGSHDDTVRLWDTATGTHLRTMTGHTDDVNGVSLSADGRLALSGSADGTLRLWDATTGTHLRTMIGHTSDVYGVSLSADGRLAMSGSRDITARLWNLGRSDATVAPGTAHANAGQDQVVVSASEVTLDGSASTDSKADNGKPIAYFWRQTAPAGTTLTTANTVTLSANNTERVAFTAPTVTSTTTLEFALTVTDALGLVDTERVTITVGTPIAVRAGDDQSAAPGVTVTLTGSRATSDNRTITYSWAQTRGEPMVSLDGAETATATFTAPTITSSNIRAGTLTFTLTATDDDGLTEQDSVTVQVGGAARLFTVRSHEAAVRGVSISRDGSIAVSGGIDGAVRLWNAETGTAIRTLGHHDGAVYAVAINADGTHAISGGADGTVRLWTWSETSGGEVLYENGTRSLGDKGIWVYAVALNKDGSRAASGGFAGEVRVWNTATSGANAGGEITYGVSGETRSLGSHILLSIHDDPIIMGEAVPLPTSIYGVSMNDDGSRVLSGGADGTVRLWNVDSGTQERSLIDDDDDPMGVVFGVSLSGDGTVAAAGSADNNVHVWNAITGTEMHELVGHSVDVSSVSLNADKTRVVSAGGDGTVRLWSVGETDTTNGREMRVLRRHTDYAWSASLSGDAIVAVSGGGDGTLHFWNTATQPPDTTETFQTAERDRDPAATDDIRSRELIGHAISVVDVSLSADGRLALTGGLDETVRLWDATTGAHLRTMTGHTDWVRSVSLSADGRLALSGSDDNTLRLWDGTTGARLHTMTGHTDIVWGVSLSADGRLALSGGPDRTVRLWDTTTGTRLHAITGHAYHVRDVSLSADGHLALSGGYDGAVRLWDATTGTRLRTMTGHTELISGVSLSADGRLALSGGSDGTVRLWDATTGTHLRTMTGPVNSGAARVSLSADGRLALSSSIGVVLLWDTTTGTHLRTMTGHTDLVDDVSLSADGRLALSGGGLDRTARLWSLGRSDATVVPGTADADAGQDQVVAATSEATLDGSASTDTRTDNGKPVAYFWRQTAPAGTTLTAANTVTLSANNTETVTFIAPTVTSNTTLEFALTVTDALGLVDTEAVTITVVPPVTAKAGDDRPAVPGTVVTLAGSGGPGDGRAIVYSWAQTGGEPMVSLDGADTATATFTAPTITITTASIRAGTLTFTLTAMGEHGSITQDSVTIQLDGAPPFIREDHGTSVRGVSISRDGSLAVSGGIDGAVRLWNAETGTAIHTLGHHDGAVYAVAINADGTHAISGGADGTVRLWTWDEASGGEVLYRNDTRSLGDKGIWVYAVALNKDGSRAASGGFDGRVRVWNTATSGFNPGWEITYGVSGRSLGRHTVVNSNGTTEKGDDVPLPTSVYGVSMNDDGSRVLSGGADGTVRLWNVDSGAEVRSLTNGDGGPVGVVFGVSLSGDGTVAAAGGADNNVHVWNATTGTEMHELAGHSADVSSVSLSADKTRVLSAGGDGTVRLWNVGETDTANGRDIRVLRRHADYAWSASLSGDAIVAVSGGGDGVLHFWNTTTEPPDAAETFQTTERDRDPSVPDDIRFRQLAGHTDSIFDVSLSADGRLALSGSEDNTVRLWDATTGAHLRTMTGHADLVLSVSLSADGRLALSGSDDNTLRLWDAATGTQLRTMTDHANSIVDVSLSADGRLALSRGYDQTLRLWDTSTGAQLRTIAGGSSFIYGLSLSADGSRALSVRRDNTVQLLDTTTGRRLRTMFVPGQDDIRSVSLSADGQLALSGREGGTMRIWDTTTGTRLHTVTAPGRSTIYSVSLSADGRLALSSSRYGAHLWDATTGTHLRTMVGHADLVRSVSLSADGRLALSGSRDRTARLWSLGRSDATIIPGTADADAGGDQSVAAASEATLDGSASTDSRTDNGKPIAYFWRQTAPAGTTLTAANTVTLSANDTATVTFTTPTVTSNTTLEFALTVTDAHGLVDTETATVTVTPASGGASRALTEATARSRSAISADAPPGMRTSSPTGAASRTSSAATPAPDAAWGASPGCAADDHGTTHTPRGRMRGVHCVYPASLLGTDNALDADMTIPALPNGGAHIFQGSLVVGRDTGDGPTLNVEAGAVLAFEGASSTLIVNRGARLHAVGSSDKPITLTSFGDVDGSPKSLDGMPRWGGIEVNGFGADDGSGRLEYVVVKHGAAKDAGGSISLRNVGSDTVVRNIQAYDAIGDGLSLVAGAVDIENFVAVYVGGDAINIGEGWSGSLANALVIQPKRGGDHCLNAGDLGVAPNPAAGTRVAQKHPASVSGLTCIASPGSTAENGQGLGAGIRLGAGSAPIIERSLVVGVFANGPRTADAPTTVGARALGGYCLRIDHHAPQDAREARPLAPSSPTLVGNIFACGNKAAGGPMPSGASVEAWAASGNNQFADVKLPTDPTPASDTHLQLLSGTPPVYSLDYDELRVNGTDATVTPPEGTDFPGAASQSATPSWLRPDGIDWTYGIFEGSRTEPLWFETAR